MQVVLYKVIAKRTKDGFKTVKREVLGATGDDPNAYLDRLARILAVNLNTQHKREVDKLSKAATEPRAQPGA
ncbi:hypothetical protein SPSYN_00896 [Sporotomaculum syntrophicum]|uniref:Uncharacterized protein n=1 Tax=Sporotomaculum syntrophicum TaxID=182264 RepID=A0A9D3AX13_9FIRM|nr:hypothetical protein [Sporotomaculum syntrophicum]KAF1086155.1 hypothetical protein SPSYN_00896 [Sporotomaculum syntrophicum]